MKELRVISFLPAATEMMFALGLGDDLVGVSHECDFPVAARNKPVVVKNALQLEGLSEGEIDAVVSERVRNGESLYAVDERLLEQLSPTHILTQDLCHVCAPSGQEIAHALNALAEKPRIVWFTPRSIADIFENLRDLGEMTGRLCEAHQLIATARSRLQKVNDVLHDVPRPRVLCLEWTDPFYCCGHWVPEMIEMAGGYDRLGRKGADSIRIPWAEIAAKSPEILIVAPCGFDTRKAVELAGRLLQRPDWSNLPAVRQNFVYAVDANAYFARPGPRIVDGVELLAHLIHPDLCPWNGPSEAFAQIRPLSYSGRA
jgi:iron complex transport system substrate-binding protein